MRVSELLQRAGCITLKAINPSFQDLWTSQKKFYLTKIDDHEFAMGKLVLFKEYCDIEDKFFPRSILAKINYLFTDHQMGLKEGYIIFGFEIIALLSNDEDLQTLSYFGYEDLRANELKSIKIPQKINMSSYRKNLRLRLN